MRCARIALLLSGLVTGLMSCSAGSGSELAGTGSQTGNTVVSGVILDASSQPVPSALVRLRPLSWTDSIVTTYPGYACIKDTRTDSLGRYRFDSVSSGIYRIEARKDSLAALLGVRLAGTSIEAASTSLRAVASLAGEIHLNDSTRGGRLEIYGLDRALTLPDTGMEVHFRLDSLPEGNHTVRLWSPRLGRAVLEMNVLLVSGKVTSLGDEQWSRDPEGPKDIE